MGKVKNYFLYQLKNNIQIPIILSVLFFLVFLNTNMLINYRIEYKSEQYDLSFLKFKEIFFTALGTTFLIAFIQIKYLKNRRIAEMIYSFPLKKSEIRAINYVTGLIYFLIPYIVFYALFMIAPIIKGVEYNIGIALIILILSANFLIMNYTFFFFVADTTDNLLDGIIFSLLLFIIPPFFQLMVSFAYNKVFNIDFLNLLNVYAYFEIINVFNNGLINGQVHIENLNISIVVFTIIFNLIASIGFIYIFIYQKNKVEDIEQPTKNNFAYDIAYPVLSFAILSISVFSADNAYIVVIIVALFAIISYLVMIVKNHSKKIRKIDLIANSLAILIGLINGLICK